MTTGRDAVLSSASPPSTVTASVGVKRRNQMLRSGSTVTSFVKTPLTGVMFAEHLRSRNLRKPRLTVPLERREASDRAERNEIATRVFQGRGILGLLVGGDDDIVVLRFRDSTKYVMKCEESLEG